MIFLDIIFSEIETEIFRNFVESFSIEVKIIYVIDKNTLFYEGIISGEKIMFPIDSPHRMLEISGLYLLEESDNLGVWSMGALSDEKKYVFWGEYGTLDNAIRSL